MSNQKEKKIPIRLKIGGINQALHQVKDRYTLFQKYQEHNNKPNNLTHTSVSNKTATATNNPLQLQIIKPKIRDDYFRLKLSPGKDNSKNTTFITNLNCNLEHDFQGIIKNTITNNQLPEGCNFIQFKDFAEPVKFQNISPMLKKTETRRRDQEFLERISTPIDSKQMNHTFNNFRKNRGLFLIKEGLNLKKINKQLSPPNLLVDKTRLSKAMNIKKESGRYKNTSIDLDNPMNNHLLKMQRVNKNFIKLHININRSSSKPKENRSIPKMNTVLVKKLKNKVNNETNKDINNISKILNNSKDTALSISSNESFLKNKVCQVNMINPNSKTSSVRPSLRKGRVSRTGITTCSISLERLREVNGARTQNIMDVKQLREIYNSNPDSNRVKPFIYSNYNDKLRNSNKSFIQKNHTLASSLFKVNRKEEESLLRPKQRLLTNYKIQSRIEE